LPHPSRFGQPLASIEGVPPDLRQASAGCRFAPRCSYAVAACRRHELIFTAFCPLARGRMFNDPILGGIARRRGRTIAQVALRWLLQKFVDPDITPLPKPKNR
jgi:diketogulonate reductase-like aldo/keto reductase